MELVRLSLAQQTRSLNSRQVIDRALSEVGTVWLLGCGNMGGALLQRWLADGLRVSVIDPAARELPDSVMAAAAPPTGAGPDVLVVAVKPQMLPTAAAPVLARLKPGTLIVSVVAGVDCAALSALFEGREVVRTMPNTPARIGEGVTALFAPGAGRAVAEALFAAVGACVWLGDEAQFDAVTAVSGSGPAYLFAMIEALSAAGVAAGLPVTLADELAVRTVAGAGRLAELGEATPTTLRDSVTSPGGTTAAGLALLQPALTRLMTATVAAAARRSRELGYPV